MVSPFRALVVDDDELMLRTVGRMLLRIGFDVCLERCPRSALARLTSGEAFDVLISDVDMPALSGPVLLRAACEAGVQIPALLMSGGARAGGVEVALEKPFTLETLIRALGRIGVQSTTAHR